MNRIPHLQDEVVIMIVSKNKLTFMRVWQRIIDALAGIAVGALLMWTMR